MDNNRLLDLTRRRLQGMTGFHPVQRVRLARRVRALEEAERDITSTGVTGFTRSAETPGKNNFPTYQAQVAAAYEMYEARGDFGAELFGSVVDMRVAFICGDGASIVSKSEAAKDWAKKFLSVNKLDGSALIDLVTTAELEGRNLLTIRKDTLSTGLAKDKNANVVRVDEILWNLVKYTVDEPGKVFRTAIYKADDKDQTVSAKDSVYLVTGRRIYNNHQLTPGRLHKVITDFQNFSRAKYDLRSNTHLFGKTTPNVETDTPADAAAVNALVKDSQWAIGDMLIGKKLSLVEPSGSAGNAIQQDALLALKLVSSASGVPMHWLAWPELMSNRATAENLMEVVNAATIKERRIWEEALTELVRKAAIFAVDNTGEAKTIIDPEIKVKMSLVSLATVKAYVETYAPLIDEMLSRQTFVAGLPGTYDYEEEQALIAEEQKERAENSPMQNGALDEALKKLQNGKPAAGDDEEGNDGDEVPGADGAE